MRLTMFATIVLLSGVISSAFAARYVRGGAPELGERAALSRTSAESPQTAPNLRISLSGAEEVVVSWRDQACTPMDFPDLPARGFRDASGQIQLMSTAGEANYRSIGPDLDHLTHSCQPIFTSPQVADPAAFDDHWWLGSFYTADGTTIYSLVHMEYHGHEYDKQCTQGYFGCWWNSITFAESTDGGAIYTAPAPPAQLVATFPYRYVPDHGAAVGYGKPSNIVLKDGYYYAMLLMYSGPGRQYQDQPGGMCVIRTDTIADPASWRGWDGSDFSVRFANPYADSTFTAADHLCTPVSPSQLNPRMSASLTFNSYLNQWLLVDDNDAPDPADSTKRLGGFYFSVSDDLINWSPRQLFLSSGILNGWTCGNPDPVKYPSLIDPTSPARNFDTTSKTMYLYYTRLHVSNCTLGWDRDLVRVPIELDGSLPSTVQPLPVPPWAPSAALSAADVLDWCAPRCSAANFGPSTGAAVIPGQALHFNGNGMCVAFTVPAGVVLRYSDGVMGSPAFGPAMLPKVCMADLARR